MDFNATIDLIIKDLEDARKIIDDLKKYPGVPSLQVEFAKSKCKSAAEIIALLKNMDLHGPAQPEQVKASPAREVKQEQQESVESLKEETYTEVSERREPELRKIEDKPEVKKNEVEPETKRNEGEHELKIVEPQKKENEAPPQIIRTEVTKSEIVTTEEVKPEEDESIHYPETESIKKEETRKVIVKTSKSVILADQFSHLSSRFNEDVSKKTLFEAIGINDRFLFIREIFKGNKVAYSEAIQKLEKSENLNEAKAIIMSYTGKNDDNEAVLQLLNLVKRKLHLHE